MTKIDESLYSIYCYSNKVCEYEVKSSLFQTNIAYYEGAGIYFDYYAPDMDINELTFINNTAPYGKTVASYPF